MIYALKIVSSTMSTIYKVRNHHRHAENSLILCLGYMPGYCWVVGKFSALPLWEDLLTFVLGVGFGVQHFLNF